MADEGAEMEKTVRAEKEEPIRVLQVLGRLDRGGAETMILNLYRRMDRQRVQFDFVIHTEESCDYSREVEALGGRIYGMRPLRVSTALAYRKQWRAFFKKHPEYRLVHGHMRSTASLYLAEAARAGCVTIAHSHNTTSGQGASALVKDVLQYPLRHQADYLFACSKKAGVWLFGKKACQGPSFHLLLNGIEPELFAYTEEKRQEVRRQMDAEEKLIFLHVGRLEWQKNHAFLFRVFREACGMAASQAAGRECRLWLCGTGDDVLRIRQLAEEEGIGDKVDFLGVREDVAELMAAADVMVFPSLFEGLPVTLVEAQCAGLPVLMSDAITGEVMLTDWIEMASLEAPPAAWAEEALRMAAVKRQDGRAAVREGGYDVAQQAMWLQNFYEQVWPG